MTGPFPFFTTFRAGSSFGGGAVEFDAWLDQVCRQRPVLLAVDDLQWADLVF